MTDSPQHDFMPSRYPDDEVDQSQVAAVAGLIQDEQRLANLGLRGLGSANGDELRRGMCRLDELLEGEKASGYTAGKASGYMVGKTDGSRTGFALGAAIGLAAGLLFTVLL